MTTIDLDRFWAPQSAQYLAELEADILANGIRHPVELAADGSILNGRTRTRICEKHGLECVTIVLDNIVTDEQKAEYVAMSHPHRKLEPTQRGAIVDALRRAGWSDRKIGAWLGIDHKTVAKASTGEDSPVDKRTGRDGKKRPSARATADQLATRRAAVVEYASRGYSRNAIAGALGIAHGTVATDCAAAGVHLSASRADSPDPVDWRAGEMPKGAKKPKPAPKPVVPRWHSLRPIAQIGILAADYDEQSYLNVVAVAVLEAIAAEDEAWLHMTATTFERAHDQLGRLVRVMHDESYRVQAIHGLESRVPGGSGLRAVKDATP